MLKKKVPCRRVGMVLANQFSHEALKFNSCDRHAQAPKYIVECFGVLRWTRQRECFGVLRWSEVLWSSEVDKTFAFQAA